MSSPAFARPVPAAALLPETWRLTVAGLGLHVWKPFVLAAAIAAVLAVTFTAWTALRIGGDQATIDVDDIGQAVAAFMAAGSCAFAAYRNSRRTRFAWSMFAASAASWGIGETIWSVYQVGLAVAVPFPSAADGGFLLAVPLAVTGVFAFTASPRRLTTRSEALLSGAIVALSLLFIAWAFGLGKVYESSPASPVFQAIGDIITAAVLVLALRRARNTDVGRLALLLGGLASNALADSAFEMPTSTVRNSSVSAR